MRIQLSAARPLFGNRPTTEQVQEKVTQKLNEKNIQYSAIFRTPVIDEILVFFLSEREMASGKAALKQLPAALEHEEENKLIINGHVVSFWADLQISN